MVERILRDRRTLWVRAPRYFKFWLSPLGVEGFHHNFIVTHFLAPLLPTLGTVYYNGYWLVPTLESGADALEAFSIPSGLLTRKCRATRSWSPIT